MPVLSLANNLSYVYTQSPIKTKNDIKDGGDDTSSFTYAFSYFQILASQTHSILKMPGGTYLGYFRHLYRMSICCSFMKST